MKTIDIERLKDNLLTLAEIGKDETGGSHQAGVL